MAITRKPTLPRLPTRCLCALTATGAASNKHIVSYYRILARSVRPRFRSPENAATESRQRHIASRISHPLSLPDLRAMQLPVALSFPLTT